MGELHLHVLGVTRIERDAVPVKLVRRKSLALLVYLIITKRVHSRAALADFLAGSGAHSDVCEHLRNSLSELAAHPQLRDYMVVTRHTAAFNSELPHWTDVAAFEAALAAAVEGDSVDALQAAIGLHQDQFMAGFAVRDAPAFEEWMLLERERLCDHLIHAQQLLTQLCIKQGRLAEGVAAARQLLDLDPWREEAHRQLMAALACTGQRSAALAQYETCRHVLATELGVEPLSETRALRDRLRRGVEVPRHNLPIPAAPLVGREGELATLMERLSDPTCRLISIVGPSGSGKSRLALEAAHRCTTRAFAGAGHPFPDGVFVADFAAPSGPGERRTPLAIAQALGLPNVGSGASAAQVAAALHDQERLVILDNVSRSCNVRDTVEIVLRQAPGVTMLLTASEPLRLPGEWTQQLGGLALPASPAELECAPAGRLFLQHAQRVRPSFTMAEADRDHVLRLCTLLGGLPGALLQAASWVRGMRCAEIVEELERVPVPTSKRRRHAAAWPGPTAGLSVALPSLLYTDRHGVRQRLSAYYGGAGRNEQAYRPAYLA